MKLYCGDCGKVVSNELPSGAVVRAIISCPECYAIEMGIPTEHLNPGPPITQDAE